ncbi:MAG: pantoate--beta-alanine ligase [Acidobacteriota bacterium]
MAELRRVETITALREVVRSWRAAGERIAFVPTMGALHEGHLSLVRRANELAERTVVSIFVNPTQFGPDEDLDRYPRTIEKDCDELSAIADEPGGGMPGSGCDLVFLPSAAAIYPPDGDPASVRTWVDVEDVSSGFEGDERPGHFRGVATVVAKLLHLVQPDIAVFGQKDAQQLAVVRRMVADLHLPIEIIGAPIVREADGLALSSRNRYLDPEQRAAAQVLSRALRAARSALDDGERDASAIERLVRAVLDAESLGHCDYVGVVDADDFQPVERISDRTVIPIAYRLGSTRLLDNFLFDPDADREPNPNLGTTS